MRLEYSEQWEGDWWMNQRTIDKLRENSVQCRQGKRSSVSGSLKCSVNIKLEHGVPVELPNGGYVVCYGARVHYFENKEEEVAWKKAQRERHARHLEARRRQGGRESF